MSEPGSNPTLHGKYQLIAELGHGGMADVYLAVLRQMKDFQKLAVLKRLRPHLVEDPEFLAMFLQEARIAARLNHPNVVHTFEVGFDGKHHFIAMEFLQGHPYSSLIARVGRDKLDLALQLKILIEALEGLGYAHDLKDFDGKPLGLVHRDISPQNIFITYEGQVKILDFGIAKAFDSAVETRTGVVKGKLSYMAPEQAFGNPVDNRSDLYAVGVLLWEIVAERRRWKGLSNIEVMKRIVASENSLELPPIEERGFPASLRTVLTRALAFEAENRYQTALEFQADLEKVLDEMGKRVAARDLGRFVAEQFAEDRKQLETVIDEQIKALDARTPDVNVTFPAQALASIDVPGASFTPTLGSPGVVTPRSAAGASTENSATVSVSELVDAAAKRRSRPVAWLAAVLGLLFVVAAVGLAIRERSRAAHSSAEPPIAETKPSEVKIKISAVPASAVLYLDGRRLAPNPYVGTLPRGDGSAEVRAESAGYESETRSVKLDSDIDLEIALKPSNPTQLTAAAPSASGRKAIGAKHIGGYATPHAPEGAPVEPEKAPPTAPAAAPEMKPPSPRPKAGVTLDTGNPWEKK